MDKTHKKQLFRDKCTGFKEELDSKNKDFVVKISEDLTDYHR